MPFIGTVSSGGASALGDLSDIGTMGEPIAQADNLTEVVTALGGASSLRTAMDLDTPATRAAQQRLDARLRTSPLAVQSLSGSSGWLGATGVAVDHMPVACGTSGAVSVYASQAGGYATGFAVHRGIWTTRGFLVSVYDDDFYVFAMNTSVPPHARMAGVVATVGWHGVAWSISADGASVRYSVDGGSAASATIIDGPLAFVAPDVGDAPHVLYDASTSGSAVAYGYIGLWSEILSDADLALLSANPSEGAPDLDAISGGDPAWEWCAAAAGADRIVISDVLYSVTATRPLVWAP